MGGQHPQATPVQQPGQTRAAASTARHGATQRTAQHSAAQRNAAERSTAQRSTAHKQAAEQQRVGREWPGSFPGRFWRSCGTHSRVRTPSEKKRAGPGGGRQEVRAIADGDHDGFKTLTYRRWFSSREGMEKGVPGGGARSQFWQVLCSKEDVERVAEFRMGSHRLEVEEGRFRSVHLGTCLGAIACASCAAVG